MIFKLDSWIKEKNVYGDLTQWQVGHDFKVGENENNNISRWNNNWFKLRVQDCNHRESSRDALLEFIVSTETLSVCLRL